MRSLFAPLLFLAVPAAAQVTSGGFVDAAYLYDPNRPANHLFRSRGTAFHVNEWDGNMAAVYVRKPATEQSRWGGEFTLQTGKDSEVFGFSATAPNIRGYGWLRHLGPANVSYQAKNGLTVQGGIFSSLIGYDSLYAKDNFNYTRPWGADFTPYLMMGVNASYSFSSRLSGSLFAVNGYWHLAHANDVPSTGAQAAYKINDQLSLKQTVMAGPHQSETSLEFWRYLSDSIMEHKTGRRAIAFEFIAGTERVAGPGNPRALWIASQLPVHWVLTPRLSTTIRPELYWDRDGRTTLFRQTVKANTTTLDYRIPYRKTTTIVRLEHRIDDSRGRQGGFFKDGDEQLTPSQNLFIVALIATFESHR